MMKKFFCMAAAAMLLASCGVTGHLTRNQNVTQTEILLSTNNYRIVRTVEGQAEATYVLGIGGLSRRALKDNAYADMVRKAQLTGSQAIINVNTSEKRQAVLLPIYQHRTITTSGTVIEFIEKAARNVGSPDVSEAVIHYTTTDSRPLEIDTQKYPGLTDIGVQDRSRAIAVAGGSIPAGAFCDCDRLIHVTFSEGIAAIGPDAFNGCEKLKQIICRSVVPPALGIGAFDGISYNAYIQVPRGAKEVYVASEGWGEYASIIKEM